MSTEPTLTDVYERLGRLTAGVEGLKDHLTKEDADRERLADKVDGIDNRTVRLESAFTKMEPTVEGFAALESKAVGGIAVLVFVGGVAGWFAGLWLTEIKFWLIRIITGH